MKKIKEKKIEPENSLREFQELPLECQRVALSSVFFNKAGELNLDDLRKKLGKLNLESSVIDKAIDILITDVIKYLKPLEYTMTNAYSNYWNMLVRERNTNYETVR